MLGSVERAAPRPLPCSEAPPDLSLQPSFSPLENYTGTSDLTAVTLCHAVTGSILFDSFRHFNGPSAGDHVEQARPAGVPRVLGRRR